MVGLGDFLSAWSCSILATFTLAFASIIGTKASTVRSRRSIAASCCVSWVSSASWSLRYLDICPRALFQPDAADPLAPLAELPRASHFWNVGCLLVVRLGYLPFRLRLGNARLGRLLRTSQAGAWSLAPSSPRTRLSTPASTRRLRKSVKRNKPDVGGHSSIYPVQVRASLARAYRSPWLLEARTASSRQSSL